jgi:type VII secretion protein EccE
VAAEVVAAVAVLLVAARPALWWCWIAVLVAVIGIGLGVVTGSDLPPGSVWRLPTAVRWWSRVRRRARATTAPPAAGPHGAVAALQTIGGPLRVTTVERVGCTIGVGQDGGGWFAACELTPRDDIRPDGSPAPPPSVLARIFQEGRDPSAVQVVSHAVAPTMVLPADAPAAASYRLLAGAHLPAAALFRWVAVRVDAYDGAAVAARHGGDWTAPATAAAAAVLRASRILRTAGFPCRVLDGRELTMALAHADLTVGAVQPRERWSAVTTGGGPAQVGYAMDALPPPFAAALTDFPPVSTTLSTTLVPGVDGPAALPASGAVRPRRDPTTPCWLRHLVRFVAPPDWLADQHTAVRASAARSGVLLTRLDGRHGPAVQAAGPTAAALPPTGGYATVAAAAGADPLDVPWHPASPDSAAATAGGCGVMLGRGADQRPAIVRIFRPWPTEVAMVGGLSTVGVLVLRAVAVGARVYVRTARPAHWQPLVNAAWDRHRIVVGGDPPPVSDPLQPALLIDDTDLDSSAGWQTAAGWQARLTVIQHLTEAAAPRLAAAHLTVLTRLTTAEADIAARELRLPGDTAPGLVRLPDEMITLVGAGVDGHAWLEPTTWERAATGTVAPGAPMPPGPPGPAAPYPTNAMRAAAPDPVSDPVPDGSPPAAGPPGAGPPGAGPDAVLGPADTA